MPSPLPKVIAGMLSPSSYPHPADRIQLIQTHVSFVILAGDFAYKIKKQLNLHFLDYSTLERRRLMCEEEVRLNRRLCTDAYLGVSSIVRSGERFVVDGPGVAVEYAVKMRRMPQDRMLPQLIAHGTATPADIARVAGVVAAFHRAAETNDYIASFGGVDTLRTNWQENFEQTAAQIGRTIGVARRDAIRRYVERFLGADAELVATRAASGRVRDCHGDLRSDSVVIGNDGSVCVMDCIEFSDRIRFGDVASDIAFLAMDLEFRGRLDLADEFIAAYLGESPDETLPLVLDFYRCYRAYVRGKVESIESDEPEVPDAERLAAATRASDYFALAHRYATARYPRVVVMVMGLSGSGKSYIAAALAGRIGAAHVSSDATRASVVAGEAPASVLPYGAGAYSDDARARVYEEMHKRAAQHVLLDRSAVLDATYVRRDHRVAARRIAKEANIRFLAVEVVASEDVIHERMTRRDDGAPLSDARWHIFVEQRRLLEPPDELRDDDLMRVDGGAPLRTGVEAVLARLVSSAVQ